MGSEKTDQIAWMHRLIGVFAGRTRHIVGFVVPWFKFYSLLFQLYHNFVENMDEKNYFLNKTMHRKYCSSFFYKGNSPFWKAIYSKKILLPWAANSFFLE